MIENRKLRNREVEEFKLEIERIQDANFKVEETVR